MMGKRRSEIDIFKGILTITMILCHCIQFFGMEEQGVQKVLRDVINIATFSGFLFCFGYVGNLAYYQKNWGISARKMGKNAVRILIAFYISGIAYVAFVEEKIFQWKFITEVLLLKKYPGWSEFLVSFAAILFVGIAVFPLMKRMNGIILGVIVAISAVSCFIPYDSIHNSWLALFTGSRDFTTFPVLQYGVFFAAGVWMCKKEIKWNIWLMIGTIAVGIPCWWQYIREGYLPERFPPSLFFICGGCVFVYLYFLLSCWAAKRRENNKAVEIVSGYLERTGQDSLYYLLLSNILIFALDGSNFSFRSEVYAYAFFIMILLLIPYLGQLKNTRKKEKITEG
ncbi:MAG: DUF1624 domain-containing protein [Clostridia bacterium]|nr:DUF1624 domain-containing protein [Clostridia bacterium]NCC42092.1 DUF1624 domain-containing protein [Clostridia bacterium]